MYNVDHGHIDKGTNYVISQEGHVKISILRR
jgi:hypothetical protein